MSNVFRKIKNNDVHQRPFKAYKSYKVLGLGIGPAHVTQSGIYYGISKDLHLPGRIDHNGEIPYPLNDDGTNMYVAWHAIKQKYYDSRTSALPEHILNPSNKRSLFISSSTLTIPYHQTGERIKNNTFEVSGTIGLNTVHLSDDGNGNLVDTMIDTTTFASSSKNFFYMSFNDMFQQYKEYKSTGLGLLSGSISYILNGQKRNAQHNGQIFISPGVATTGSHACYNEKASGLGVKFGDASGSQIRISHHPVFNRFGHCDDWTISFWAKNNNAAASTDVVLSKHALIEKLSYNTEDNNLQFQDFTLANLTDTSVTESRHRVPFHITIASNATGAPFQLVTMEASDGTHNIAGDVLGLPFPAVFQTCVAPLGTWHHWVIRNSGSLLQVFADGSTEGSYSGSLPSGVTANSADVTIGSRTKTINETRDVEFAEFRMYDYAVSDAGIQSLANNEYTSGSLYQTNVVGNVFHRNGQVVVSSPMPKYHSGSGFFSTDYTWRADYRGVHTIYENQAFVRVPKDVLNVTINPSSTYTPPTDGGTPCDANEANLLPGEVRKGLFVSGTLRPYITTIGLYNDEQQLLAVGKLAQPIEKRDDIDMNFVIRWDY